MEEVEVTFVVGAIGWLVQTILESLFSGKLEAWIRGVGLADDTEKLRSEIERVEMVVAAVKGRAVGNKPLARSLARLKELLYDADDLIDELDYYRLQQQVQGVAWHDTDGTDGHGAAAGQVERPRGNADIPSSSRGKKRSKAWGDFEITEEVNGKPMKAKCIHCHTVVKCGSDKGTSVLHNHLKSDGCKKKRGASDQQPNTSSAADGTANGTLVAVGDSRSRKRMRMHEESTHNTAANAHPWNKAEFSNRIRQITRQLQDITGAVREVLKLHGSDSVASSNHYWSTRSDVCPGTSSLNQRKIYGRDAEKNSIIKMITADIYDGITVLPIVGIGGVGKTALAQHVYDDPTVKSQFDRIWVWVSNNFDEVRLTREMLDFVSQKRHEESPQKKERHAGISSFAKLQEILKGHMGFQSKRFLLILDDVWDNMDSYQWNKLLTPLKSSRVKGNVILVTTRKLSVAQRIGKAKPIKLDSLAYDDFLLLFKACAFDDENYEWHRSLKAIGLQIAHKLKGNPLAAETAGALLREQLTVDHWSNILKNQDWKSLQLSRGIMPALKLSYDQLPYHLQQCFLYCCIFPRNYQFVSEELICIWIAQGFVNGGHSSKRLEEIGQDYLFDLVNSGFFQQTEREVPSLGNKTCYVMCGLMHDFAMAVSRTECATIDGLQCNEMLPTVHHLSIVTGSAYSEDQHANILRNEEFEKKLLNVVTSVRRLRTLVLIGQYDTSFFQLFQNLFKEAQNLRLLQISGNCAGFNSFMCNLANPTHLRYLKLEAGEEDVSLPQVLSKFYHLQVLAVGSETDFTRSNGVNNLVSLRHLVATSLTSLQTLHLECCGKWQILPSLERLLFLRKLELRNMRNVTEVLLPSLEELVLDEMPKMERCSCTSVRDLNSSLRVLKIKRCPVLEVFPLFESSQKFKIEQKSWLSSLGELVIHECPQLLVSHPLPPSTSVSKLSISGVSTLPTMEGSSSGTLRIGASDYYFASFLDSDVDYVFYEPSNELRTLDGKMLSFQNLRFLTQLIIAGCRNLTSISFKGLRQLISLKSLEITDCKELFSSQFLPEHTHEDMVAADCNALPSLERLCIESCGITGTWLSVMLRHVQALEELILQDCPPMVEEEENSRSNLILAREAWSSAYPNDELIRSAPEGLLRIPLNVISSLKKISITECPDLTFYGSKDGFAGFTSLVELNIFGCPKLLPSSVHKDGNDEQANGRWLLPQSLGELVIGGDYPETLQPCFPENLTCLKKLQVWGNPSLKSLQLHSCTALEEMDIRGSGSFISLEGLQFLGSLRLLRASGCLGDHEQDGRWLLPQSVGELKITGDCPETLQPCFPENLTCLKKLRVWGSPSLKSLQLHSCTALEELEIEGYSGSFISLEGLQFLGSLRWLRASGCLVHHEQDGRWLLPQSLGELKIFGDSPETLQPCFPENLTCLKKLKVERSTRLKSLQLHSCTALEELEIEGTGSFISLEGLQFLGNLRLLRASGCLGDHEQDGRWLLPQSLGELQIKGNSPETLLPCFPENLTRLKILQVQNNPGLKSLQLHSCTALEELTIRYCGSLDSIEGLQSLGALRHLIVFKCPGLPPCFENLSIPQLETLEIDDPSALTSSFCKHLTSLQQLRCTSIQQFRYWRWTRLTDEQERALQLLASLKELQFVGYWNLVDLPPGLHSLSNLRRLKIEYCQGISRLPEKGLPPSLEELQILGCSDELTDQCRKLATSKLKVKINEKYVN